MNRFFSLWTIAVVLGAFLGGAGIIRAAATTEPSDKALKGTIVSIASDNTSIVVNTGTKKSPSNTTVTVDAKTTYTLDGNTVKITDLKAGLQVSITPATGTAKTVTATTPTTKKKGGGGGGGGGGN